MDSIFMQHAIGQSAYARFVAPPNPWVGCVVVKDDHVIGSGYTQPPGGAHAEIQALSSAGSAAAGATVYVTLEPCSHVGRTGPCTDALIAADVSRVVVGIEDPDPNVAGQGIERLRKAGIRVDVGVCSDQISEDLAAYLHHRRTGKAYALLKVATSLDGRTASADGQSQWITSEAARQDTHWLRDQSQAILVGSGTALADRPSLTIRHHQRKSAKAPLRVLLDRRGRVPATGPLFDQTLAPTLVITSKTAPQNRVDEWEKTGAEVVRMDEKHPEAIFHLLGKRGILQVLIEGGATLSHQLIQWNAIDKLTLYFGPKLLGQHAIPLLSGPSPSTLADAPNWTLINTQTFNNDIRLDYLPLTASGKWTKMQNSST